MQEIKNTGQLVLAFNKELITPAKISPKLLNWEAIEQTTLEIEEYMNIIIEEDSDIESITSLRKEISSSKSKIDDFRKELKSYLESESKIYNEKLSSFVKRWEAVRKYLYDLEIKADQKRIALKWKEIEELKKILVKSLVNKELMEFIIDNNKWETKSCKMNTIEADIQEQINKLNSKYNSIDLVLKGINKRIENKIKIEDIIHMFGREQEHILEFISEKEKDIRETEENMRKNAEEKKQKAVKEAEEKAIKDTEERLKATPTSYKVNISDKPKDNIKKDAFIIIKVNGLSRDKANGLLQHCKDNEIKFKFEER